VSNANSCEVVIRVRDNGAGIPLEKQSRLFEMFYQVNPMLNRQCGLGIGLALVRRIIQLHGGTVEAYSAGINQGSEFVVRLPVLSKACQPEPPPSRIVPAVNGGSRVLVVDDNRDSAESLAMLLQLNGYEVRMAHDGLEAVAAAASFHPEIILMDIGMPGLNGYDTATRIRQQPRGSDILLIALTGWGQAEDRRRTREAGFNAHLLKPVEEETLMRVLESNRDHARRTQAES
jgi:CheY-like chemotaxis protein